MIKKIVSIFFLALVAGILSAQSTTAVSATVVDSDSNTWYNGTCSVDFVPSPQAPYISQYTNQGVAVTVPTCTYTGATGAIAFTAGQNTVITPTGSMWKLTLCPKASSSCQVYVFVASGASLDLSTPLTASLTAPRFPCTTICYGYSTAEITSSAVGAIFYNTTTNSPTQYNGTSYALQNVLATFGPTNYSNTATLSPVTIYTTKAAGFYQFCAWTVVTVAGTAGSYSDVAGFTSNGHAFTGLQIGASFNANTQWTHNGNSGSLPPICPVFYADTNTAITFGITASSVTGTPTIQYMGAVFKMF